MTAYTILARDTDQMPEGEWLERRRLQGIGASEAASAAGLSKWQSPYSLWAMKTGEVNPGSAGQAARWGNKLEGVILEAFTEEVGIFVERRFQMVCSNEHPFIFANPDGWAVVDGEDVGVVQAKAPGLRMAEEWADDNVPDEYHLQVQHELYVTGFERGWLAVLIGGQDFRVIEIPRDERMIASLIHIETEMWRRIQEMDAPDIDGHRATTETIKSMWAKGDPESTINLDESILRDLRRRAALKSQLDEIKKDLDGCENGIKARLGDYEIGLVDGKPVCTWKTIHKDGYFVKPSVQRQLRVPKGVV